jgi:hypothetical protein
MGCPRPPAPRRVYAGEDALSVDLVAARHMGVREPEQTNVLRAACHWFGDPRERIELIGTDEKVKGWRGPYETEFSTLLSFVAYPVYVFGSGRGSLFVPEMDEQAFPLLERVPFLHRVLRAALRRLLGLHFPRSRKRQPAEAPT